jgi:DNA-binding NtrC family response regulator
MANARKMNLLVVDDDPAIVRLVSKVVEKQLADKVKLTALSDPLEARAWLDRNCCDLLLTDWEMPEVDGAELLQLAKRRNSCTQVIFMTAHSTWDRLSLAIESGATDYIIKPLQIEELVSLLQQQQQRFTRWQTAAVRTFALQSGR